MLMPAFECKFGGRAIVIKVVCPVCSKEIRPVSFGDGLVWVCCGKVAHSVSRAEKFKDKTAEDDAKAERSKG